MISVILSVKVNDDQLSWAGWENHALISENCEASASDGKKKALIVGLQIQSLV